MDIMLVTNILGKEMTLSVTSEKGTLQRRVTHSSGGNSEERGISAGEYHHEKNRHPTKVMLLELSFF